ncbi:MAG: substrate-binding domain-containing protein [Lachnospiraceae bacterium]|nr:substrate-binding domain-containing protein [Lachnospiraceae bacterium]
MTKETKGVESAPISNRSVIFLISTTIFAAAILIVAFLYIRFYLAGSSDEINERSYSRYYAMIAEDHKSSFWQSVYQGALEAAEKNDTYVELFGSNLLYDYSTAELMEMAVSAGVDGIMVYGNGSDEMTELINEASDKGIPVVTIYSDNSSSKRCSYVGISGYNIGREYGRQIISVSNEKRRVSYGSQDHPEEELKITMLVDSKMASYNQNLILSGIQDSMSQNPLSTGYSIKIVTVDNNNPFSVEESVRDVFMDNDVPDVLVCLNELDTTCAYQAVVDYNQVGNVYILGYYDSEKILNAISRNVVFSSLAVDTAQMGAFCVEALDEYKEFGYTSQYFAADLTLIDRNNVSEYLKKEEETDE